MATLRHVASLALCAACVRTEPDLYTTFPEPVEVAGPPSGEIDREWAGGFPDENAPFYAGDATGYAEPTAGQLPLTAACTDSEIDATLAGYGEWIEIEGYGRVWRPYTTTVGVDFTPYETCGSWVWTEWGWTFACEWDWGWLPFHYGQWGWFDDYWAWVPGYEWSPAWVEWRSGGGYVGWRPLAPQVRDHRSVRGGSSTPIVRDHRSTHGGSSTPIVRDHRGDGPSVRDHRDGPRVRDHRTRVASTKDWQWRFAAARDLGKPRIRPHLYKSLAEGLRVTTIVTRPPTRPNVRPVGVASVMQPRRTLADRMHAYPARDAQLAGGRRVDHRVDHRVGGRVELAPVAPGARVDRRTGVDRARGFEGSVVTPSWQQERPRQRSFGAVREQLDGPAQQYTPTPTPQLPHPIHDRDRYTPAQPPTVLSPSPEPAAQPPVAMPPVVQPPVAQPRPDRFGGTPPPSRADGFGGVRPTVQPVQPSPPLRDRYSPPRPLQRAPDRVAPPTYSPPVRTAPPTYSPPARASSPTYSPPSRPSAPTYSPPARSSAPTYSPPSRPSAPTYSPPARSSPPSSPPASATPRAPSGGGFGATRNHRR